MKVLFINQYAPPDQAPTARLLGDVADHLRARGHNVVTVHQRESYREHPSVGGSRLKRELTALLSILWSALTKGPKPDVVVALSSPPGVLPVAAIVALLRRARLAHWAMDLYPELAVALDEIKPGVVASATRAAMAWAYRRCSLIVVLDTDMRAHLERAYGVDSEVVRVWPSRDLAIPEAAVPNEQWAWLYSGNLGRAHDWHTLLDAQRLLEDRGLPVHLVFQGRGSVRMAAEDYGRALQLRNLRWQDYASEDELVASLLRARVLVASQREQASGFLWPSKLALLLSLPRPLLFVGPPDGAIAFDVRTASSQNAVFGGGDAFGVANRIHDEFSRGTVPVWNSETAAAVRKAINDAHDQGCAEWERWFAAAVGKH